MGVGSKQIDPFPSVRRSDFFRREYSRFNPVTQAFQVVSHLSQSFRHVPSHVLKEAPARAAFSDDPDVLWPEVSGVGRSESLTGDAEWLARVAASKDVNTSQERTGDEGA